MYGLETVALTKRQEAELEMADGWRCSYLCWERLEWIALEMSTSEGQLRLNVSEQGWHGFDISRRGIMGKGWWIWSWQAGIKEEEDRKEIDGYSEGGQAEGWMLGIWWDGGRWSIVETPEESSQRRRSKNTHILTGLCGLHFKTFIILS